MLFNIPVSGSAGDTLVPNNKVNVIAANNQIPSVKKVKVVPVNKYCMSMCQVLRRSLHFNT